MLSTGTHTLEMEEPETCAQELQELALALESEVAPAAALELSSALGTARRWPDFSPPQRAAAITHVARLGWALVMKARKEKGDTTGLSVVSPNLMDAAATSGAPKVDTTTSAVKTCKRDGDAWGAAKARGDWALAQLAAKGRGDQLGQGGRLNDKAVNKPAAPVFVGKGWREPPTGTGQPAVANASRLGGEHAWGVAKGGDAGERQHAAKGHGDQQEQGSRLAGKAAAPPARRPSLSLLERGGGGRRLALAGRRLPTRCVLVHELAGRGDWRLGGRRRPCQMG